MSAICALRRPWKRLRQAHGGGAQRCTKTWQSQFCQQVCTCVQKEKSQNSHPVILNGIQQTLFHSFLQETSQQALHKCRFFQSFHPGVTAQMPSGRIAVCWCDARDKQSQQPALTSIHAARARAAPCFGLLQCVTFAEDKCESVTKCHC